jgi:hypothetical protein
MAMKTKSTRTKPPVQDEFWGHMAEEVPRADVAAVSKADRRMKFNRRYIQANLILLPVALLGILSCVPKLTEPTPQPVIPVSEINSPTKAAAMQAVSAWLSQYPAPLPGGRLLSWDGAKVQSEPEITIDPSNDQPVEKQGLQLHSLTLVTTNGTLYTTTVQVGYSDIRGAQVIGSPTLIPRAPDDTSKWANLTSWPNLATIQATDPVKQAAEAWVKAFTSGDPNALRLAVGDQAGNHSYVPLVQATPDDVRVEEAAAAKGAEGKGAVENPSTITARVSFAVSWAGVDIDKNRAGAAPRVVYDVLIQQAETASPVIVAWGGAGTGESLKPYQNAVVDREIGADALTGPMDSRAIIAKAQAAAEAKAAAAQAKAEASAAAQAIPEPSQTDDGAGAEATPSATPSPTRTSKK